MAKHVEKTEDYTYRNGKIVHLTKSEDEAVVRTKDKAELEEKGFKEIEQTSPSSFRITVPQNKRDEIIEDLRKTMVVHHAYKKTDSKQEFLITDRIIVGFLRKPSLDVLTKFTADYSLKLISKLTETDFLFQLTDYTGMNPNKLVVELTENKKELVAFAENDLNMRVKRSSIALPTDPIYKKQWHLHTHSTNVHFKSRSSSRCEEAWQTMDSFGSQDVVVGITDDGCKLSHVDFSSNNKFASWGYMKGTRLVVKTDIDADPSKMYEEGSDHGTCCAGVIAGDVNGQFIVGAAPGCKLLPIKWQTDGDFLDISDSKLFTVLKYVSDKVDVLSNSWGGAPDNVYSTTVVNYIRQLAQTGGKHGKGILFLWAAGNSNCPLNYSSPLEIPFTDGWKFDGASWHWVGVEKSRSFTCNLVGIPGLMHIAALSSMGQRSHYSNYGPGIELCAPTSNLHEYQRIEVEGLGITTASGATAPTTDRFGGTSSATPLVAGIAALIMSANPHLTAIETVSVLKQTASKDLLMLGYPRTPPAAFDTTPTWDISPVAPFDKGDFTNAFNYEDGTWSPWFGFGKADAQAAVTEALQRKNIAHGELKIISALVNPEGVDVNNEKVSIQNMTNGDVNLVGLSIVVKGKKNPLTGQLAAGETTTVRLISTVRLSNTGSSIQLLDSSEQLLAEATYTKDMVKVGRTIVFN